VTARRDRRGRAAGSTPRKTSGPDRPILHLRSPVDLRRSGPAAGLLGSASTASDSCGLKRPVRHGIGRARCSRRRRIPRRCPMTAWNRYCSIVSETASAVSTRHPAPPPSEDTANARSRDTVAFIPSLELRGREAAAPSGETATRSGARITWPGSPVHRHGVHRPEWSHLPLTLPAAPRVSGDARSRRGGLLLSALCRARITPHSCAAPDPEDVPGARDRDPHGSRPAGQDGGSCVTWISSPGRRGSWLVAAGAGRSR
jgi:hypothetical protein